MQETNDFFSMAEFYSAMSESLRTMRIAYITYLYVGDEGSRSSETTIGVDGKKIVLPAYIPQDANVLSGELPKARRRPKVQQKNDIRKFLRIFIEKFAYVRKKPYLCRGKD